MSQLRISNPSIRLGSLIFWPSDGPFTGTMITAMKAFDPDPEIKSDIDGWSKFWHTTQVVGRNEADWVVDEAQWPESRMVLLSELVATHGSNYQVFNWLPEQDQSVMDFFSKEFYKYPYSLDSYLWVTLNRLSRNKFPRIAAQRLMCWDRTAAFTMLCGRPLMHYYEQAYMPLMVHRCLTEQMPAQLECAMPPAPWWKDCMQRMSKYILPDEVEPK